MLIFPSPKESPLLGLTGMGGGVGSNLVNFEAVQTHDNMPFWKTNADASAVDGSGQANIDEYADYLVWAMPGVDSSGTATDTDYHSVVNTGTSYGALDLNNGTPQSANTNKYYGISIRPAGNHWGSLDASTRFTWGTGPWTFECWMNSSDHGAGNSQKGNFQIGEAAGGIATSYTGAFGYWYPSKKFNFAQWNLSNPNDLTSGTWFHMAATRDSSNTARLYINGTKVAQANNQTNDVQAEYIGLGGYYSGSYCTVTHFNDIRMYKGVAKYTGDSFTMFAS